MTPAPVPSFARAPTPMPARSPTPGAFAVPPRLPTPGPIITQAPAGWPAPPQPSTATFVPPPLPDHVGGAPPEVIVEADLDFALAAAGSFGTDAALPRTEPSPLADLFDDVSLGAAPAQPTNPSAALPSTSSGESADPGAVARADAAGAFAAAETSSLPAPPPPPLAVRLRGLAERLRAEGRYDDAQMLEEAIVRLPPS